MREEVYKKLSEAESFAEQHRFEDALKTLQDIEKRRDLSNFEKSQLYTAFGFLYYNQEQYGESIQSYSLVLSLPDLPATIRTSTLYTLAQLQFQIEDYEGVIVRLNDWLEVAESPGPEPYRLLALAYYQLERHEEALQPIQTAIALVEGKGRKVDENWYGLLRVLYYELGDREKAIETLKTLIELYPSKDYWMMLAGMYGEAGMEREQIAAHEVAYRQGYLQKSDEITLFAQLLLQAKVPHRAALVLERAIADSTLEATALNYRLLSQAWTLAKEDGKSIETLKSAATLSDDGELDARLAQAYLNTDQWEKAADSARTALSKGIADVHQVQLLLGMALFHLDRFGQAKTAFRQAMSAEASRQIAANWLTYIEREQNRVNELRATLGR
jgi:tetratricopeptide (TPR) repeat protein